MLPGPLEFELLVRFHRRSRNTWPFSWMHKTSTLMAEHRSWNTHRSQSSVWYDGHLPWFTHSNISGGTTNKRRREQIRSVILRRSFLFLSSNAGPVCEVYDRRAALQSLCRFQEVASGILRCVPDPYHLRLAHGLLDDVLSPALKRTEVPLKDRKSTDTRFNISEQQTTCRILNTADYCHRTAVQVRLFY